MRVYSFEKVSSFTGKYDYTSKITDNFVFFFGWASIDAYKNKEDVLKLLETCTQYVPKAAAANVQSLECLEKGLQLRAIHVKADMPTLEDFYEVSNNVQTKLFDFQYFPFVFHNILDHNLCILLASHTENH